ncbi:MAG: 2-amino-4-hydroxy-6-hydroxymethyldihydropteridine diphosphokinase [Ardenticatenaceae bacterium]|nr:2-amino-4-hydroxy-6-hydroxymethyldihydropteridine diphosphokinase [Ardenticatenaceae bacterium]
MSNSHQLFLSLGTNIGQRHVNLRRAVHALADLMTITAISPIYQTAPWGLEAQPDFLNICLAASTPLEPVPLLQAIKTVENQLGRQPTVRWGPRLIDIDILFYNSQILTTDQLTIPHPHLTERAFVLAPLADIAPQFVHPQNGRTIHQLLAHIDQTTVHQLNDPLFKEKP